MGDGAPPDGNGSGPASPPPNLPFSVVLAPGATMAVRHVNGAFVRHLYFNDHEQNGKSSCNGAGERRPGSSYCPRLSEVVVAVRAQPCTLHFFRGRRLCRVIEFSSPVVDVAGVPPGAQGPEGLQCLPLCVVVCRDGIVYAPPGDEVLNGKRGVATVSGSGVAPMNNDAGRPNQRNGGGDFAPVTARPNNKPKYQGNHRHSPSSKMNIFDDLAPMMAEGALSAPHQPDRNGRNGSDDGGGGGGVSLNMTSIRGALGSLVVPAQDRWAICTHFGARRVVACPDGVVAVVGIVDRASLYRLSVRNGSGAPSAATEARAISPVDGVDGASPTTIAVIWIGEELEDVGSRAGGEVAEAAAIADDQVGFPLPPRVFRALFGAELAHSGTPFLPRCSEPLPTDVSGGTGNGDIAPGADNFAKVPAVLLVGDEAGTLRWTPLNPCFQVPGGVLANLEQQAVVATLPQRDSQGKTIGLLAVGAKGTVLGLRAAPRRFSRKRAKPSSHTGSLGDETKPVEDDRSAKMGLPGLYRTVFKLPFPVSSAGSTPGFLVHCHAGALFASPLPQESLADDDRGESGWDMRNSSGNSTCLWPVRLPLPCETVDFAVGYISTEEDGVSPSEDIQAKSSPRVLIVSLSARGRLVGFLAPQSTEELHGWGLDTGKGGVRVGGSAGVERRVRCQLERLSDVGRQCATLSAQSADRDNEIRILRGATKLIPTLSASHRGGGNGVDPPAFGHAISMGPDVGEHCSHHDQMLGERGPVDSLRVRLRLRLWVPEGGRRTNLPDLGAEGMGRWFVVTQIVSEAAEATRGSRGESTNGGPAEGWACSTSTAIPMASLRQGRAWSSSSPLVLPSARPVTVTAWLQLCFGEVRERVVGRGMAPGAVEPRGKIGHGTPAAEVAEGVCVELGSARFDILDWGILFSSVPGNAAAVRVAAHGRGACFCGPELAIADTFGNASTASAARLGGENLFGLKAVTSASVLSATQLPASWGSCRVRIATTDGDAAAFLARLVHPSVISSPAGFNQHGSTPECGASNVARVADGGGVGASGEIAFRLAGQVVVLRAGRPSGVAEVTIRAGSGERGDAVKFGRRTAIVIEISVTSSHAAITPLVRHALLRRSSAASKTHGTGNEARGDAAAKLTREIHSLRQAAVEADDAVKALDVARARDGPQHETVREAVALIRRVGEIYQALRHQQGGGAVV